MKIKNFTASTSGKGLWTIQKKSIKIKRINIESSKEDSMYIEVFFSEKDWNTTKDGLIYTDIKWLREFRQGLKDQKIPTAGIDYTEQGMQGRDYVSLQCYNKKTIQFFKKNKLA